MYFFFISLLNKLDYGLLYKYIIAIFYAILDNNELSAIYFDNCVKYNAYFTFSFS